MTGTLRKMREKTLLEIRIAIDGSIQELQGLISLASEKIAELEKEITSLRALVERFPDLEPFLEPIIAQLGEKAFEFSEDKKLLSDARDDLVELKKKYSDTPRAARLRFYRVLNGKKEEIKNMFHKVTEPVELEIVAEDKFGNPAQVEAGKTKLSVSDSELGAFEESPEEGKLPKFIPSGKLGKVKFQAEADADLGEGEVLIRAESEELDLIAGDAEVLKISIK